MTSQITWYKKLFSFLVVLLRSCLSINVRCYDHFLRSEDLNVWLNSYIMKRRLRSSAEILVLDPQRTQRITGSAFRISLQPDWRSRQTKQRPFFNWPIVARTQIWVHSWESRTRISALYRYSLFATFRKAKETGTEMCRAIVSGIVTGGVPVTVPEVFGKWTRFSLFLVFKWWTRD